jgi:hypothetical protein
MVAMPQNQKVEAPVTSLQLLITKLSMRRHSTKFHQGTMNNNLFTEMTVSSIMALCGF